MMQFQLLSKCTCGYPDCGLPNEATTIIVTIVNPKKDEEVKVGEEIMKLSQPHLDLPTVECHTTLANSIKVAEILTRILVSCSEDISEESKKNDNSSSSSDDFSQLKEIDVDHVKVE